MHSVNRSVEPDLIDQLRKNYTQWENLSGADRRNIRKELALEFSQLCAYCECLCKEVSNPHDRGEESIEHFRPRESFSTLWLDWLNLLYACRKCNNTKDNNWPQCGYVNPNAGGGQRLAEEFFGFNVTTGEMYPSPKISGTEYDMANQTIKEVDLNDIQIGLNDPSNICNQRRRQVQRLTQEIKQLNEPEDQVNVLLAFMMPDKPFSSFVSAYVNDRFPSISEFRD